MLSSISSNNPKFEGILMYVYFTIDKQKGKDDINHPFYEF